jgi:NAD(P)-dependent dehydrogenase (short-subunit alcohol dehydrogenase family)
VTGGGSDIGQAIVLRLAAEGASVALLVQRDRTRAEQVADAARRLGAGALALTADITDPAAVAAAVAQVCARFGRLDVLVNNAGAFARAPLLDLDPGDWDGVFAVNARGAFLCGVAAARIMIAGGGGAIVNIAGASAHRCFPGGGAYGPSKAAVVSLTQQMALEWAGHGVRVNGVSPGPIRAPASGWETQEPGLVAEVARLPLRRPGTPEDVARAVAYLASADAAYVTGHMLVVDGGGVASWYLG